MINQNSKRALAHIEVISSIDPIEGADRIEVATVLGWKVVIAKADHFKVNDKVVYIEVDSLVPADNPVFSFLADRKYRVKTIKLKGQYSQGLIMPIAAFSLKNTEIGTDVTDELGIKYYVALDELRKNGDPDAKYKSMSARHMRLSKTKWWRWLCRRAWGKKLLFVFFGKKKDKPLSFPTKFPYIHKTDEERVENMPWVLQDKEPWVRTCKIDGTSATYILERKKFGKFEFYVTSRNVRQKTLDQKNYHDIETNVYWDMAFRYNIKAFLQNYLDLHRDCWYACLQGEIAGPAIQGNPHKLKKVTFFGFNFIDSNVGRWPTQKAANLWTNYGGKWVPIIDYNYILPDTMEEMKLSADGPCDIPDSSGLREGFVYRSKDGQKSFKNVSRKYLLKYEE